MIWMMHLMTYHSGSYVLCILFSVSWKFVASVRVSIIGLIFYNSCLISSFANNPVEDVPLKKITYILSILSAEEATKAVSKWMPISMALELREKEPWDTLKAQLFMKIDMVLSPHILNFDDYMVMFYISCVLPRPGMILKTKDNYSALLLHATNLTRKTPTINITIQEKKHVENKENEGASRAGQKRGSSKDKKKVYFVMLVTLFNSHSWSFYRKGNLLFFQGMSVEPKIYRSFRTVGRARNNSQAA